MLSPAGALFCGYNLGHVSVSVLYEAFINNIVPSQPRAEKRMIVKPADTTCTFVQAPTVEVSV